MKKGKRLLLILLIMFVAVSEASMIGFAEENKNGVGTASVETQKVAEATQKPTETELIKKYGFYKGKNAKKIPVLTYHRVVSDEQKAGKYNHSSLAVSQSTFDKQVKYLKKKGYRTINCDEFYLWYKGKIKLPPKTAMITFDDAYSGVARYALPVLEKYEMKGTAFVIGSWTKKNKKGIISFKRWKKLKDSQEALEFQSHTYNLHMHYGESGMAERIKKDAKKQKSIYGFEYLAYPYGWNTASMRKAYKKAGIKLAFTYGSNGYATRKQNIYNIRRIKVHGTADFSSFKKWIK